jgi:Tol biopolymer transport system component
MAEAGSVTPRNGRLAYANFAWVRKHGHLSLGAYRVILTVNPDGTGAKYLGPGWAPIWSLDGRKLLFYQPRVAGIWSMNADGTNRHLVQLAPAEAGASCGVVGFARALASGEFACSCPQDPAHHGGVQGICAIRPGTAGVRWLLKATTLYRQPDEIEVSPDGRRIAFRESERLYVVDASGKHLRLVSTGPTGWDEGAGPPEHWWGAYGPSWSADGKRLAYIEVHADGDARREVVVVATIDGSSRRVVYRANPTAGSLDQVVWSPDGRQLAVVDNWVRVMDTNGSHVRRLIRNLVPGNPLADLSWQPVR